MRCILLVYCSHVYCIIDVDAIETMLLEALINYLSIYLSDIYLSPALAIGNRSRKSKLESESWLHYHDFGSNSDSRRLFWPIATSPGDSDSDPDS